MKPNTKKNIFGLDRPLRIFNTPWHVAHQYELYKIPETEWFHVINPVRQWSKTGYQFRPDVKNISNVPFYEPGKYDLAVLHVDQQCVDGSLGKSRLFRDLLNEVSDIPKIIINHGTPFWPEIFENDKEACLRDTNLDQERCKDKKEWSSAIVQKMRSLIGRDDYVVYNSHRAREMWGDMGKHSQAIIHGMDISEWVDLPKEPRVITSISPAGLPKYYNRQLLIEVKAELKKRGIPHVWIGVDVKPMELPEYKEFIGRSLIYFNPTLESPMPRSRTEAMLSGSCIVTLPNHGAEDFIEQGKNGFLVPNNPLPIADLIENLLDKHYKDCIEIGKRGKETAQKLFHTDRFQAEWIDLLKKVIGENKIK